MGGTPGGGMGGGKMGGTGGMGGGGPGMTPEQFSAGPGGGPGGPGGGMGGPGGGQGMMNMGAAGMPGGGFGGTGMPLGGGGLGPNTSGMGQGLPGRSSIMGGMGTMSGPQMRAAQMIGAPPRGGTTPSSAQMLARLNPNQPLGRTPAQIGTQNPMGVGPGGVGPPLGQSAQRPPIGGPSSPLFAAASGERNSFGPSDLMNPMAPPPMGRAGPPQDTIPDPARLSPTPLIPPGRDPDSASGFEGQNMRDIDPNATMGAEARHRPGRRLGRSDLSAAAGQARRATADNPMVTGYVPGAGRAGSKTRKMEGGLMGSTPPGGGQPARLNTIEKWNAGNAPYVSMAGRPDQYGRQGTWDTVKIGDKTYNDVPFRIEDTGARSLFGPGTNHFDIAHSKSPNAQVSASGLTWSGGDTGIAARATSPVPIPQPRPPGADMVPGGSPARPPGVPSQGGGAIPLPQPRPAQASQRGALPPAPPAQASQRGMPPLAPPAQASQRGPLPYQTAPQRFQPPPGQQAIPGMGQWSPQQMTPPPVQPSPAAQASSEVPGAVNAMDPSVFPPQQQQLPQAPMPQSRPAGAPGPAPSGGPPPGLDQRIAQQGQRAMREGFARSPQGQQMMRGMQAPPSMDQRIAQQGQRALREGFPGSQPGQQMQRQMAGGPRPIPGAQPGQVMSAKEMAARVRQSDPTAGHEGLLNILNANQHMLAPQDRQQLQQINRQYQRERFGLPPTRDFYPGGPNTDRDPYIGPRQSAMSAAPVGPSERQAAGFPSRAATPRSQAPSQSQAAGQQQPRPATQAAVAGRTSDGQQVRIGDYAKDERTGEWLQYTGKGWEPAAEPRQQTGKSGGKGRQRKSENPFTRAARAFKPHIGSAPRIHVRPFRTRRFHVQ